MTFTIQNVSTSATGRRAGLGYGLPVRAAMAESATVLLSSLTSTTILAKASIPLVSIRRSIAYGTAIDMSSSGVNLHSGDVFNVRMTYDGTTLSMRITDATTQATFQTSWTINIPLTVGAGTAYVGFTGATAETRQRRKSSPGFTFRKLGG